MYLPLYDDDSDNEDGETNDERQTNHDCYRQLCQHANNLARLTHCLLDFYMLYHFK